MLGRKVFPDHRDIYFAPVIGPLKIRYYHEKAKLEAICHFCPRWSDFRWTENECKVSLLKHLWARHSSQPRPVSHDVLPMPGR